MSFRSWRNALVFVSGLTLTLAAAPSCSSKDEPTTGTGADSGAPAGNQPAVTTLFSKSIASITVEIDYAPGAEPYVGTVKEFGDPWNLFNANALAVFDGKKKLEFPRTLAKMEKLDDVTAATYTTQDILAIAAAHRTEQQYSDAVAFYVVFLPGTFTDDTGTEQKETLGVSIGDTGVIGMFKPAIKTPVGNPTAVPQFVEQLALIHFFGHAVGFVDNGVPVGDTNKAHIDTGERPSLHQQAVRDELRERERHRRRRLREAVHPESGGGAARPGVPERRSAPREQAPHAVVACVT